MANEYSGIVTLTCLTNEFISFPGDLEQLRFSGLKIEAETRTYYIRSPYLISQRTSNGQNVIRIKNDKEDLSFYLHQTLLTYAAFFTLVDDCNCCNPASNIPPAAAMQRQSIISTGSAFETTTVTIPVDKTRVFLFLNGDFIDTANWTRLSASTFRIDPLNSVQADDQITIIVL